MKWKQILIISLILISGCSITNWFLWRNGESGDRTTLPVRLDTLIEMAEYCEVIYRKEGVTPNDPENASLNLLVDNQYRIKRDEFSYYVKHTEGITILVFRGTANTKNILTDIDMRMFDDDTLDLLLHRGFRDAADLIRNDIVRNYELHKTVYLTGHSLGGAVAQIIGMWLHEEGYNVQIFTFGSPKVTTKFLFNEPNHWRVAVRSDPVPYMPSLPYVHSGIHIDPESLDWDSSHEEDSFLQIDGLDHSIEEYLDLLKERKEG